MRQGTCGEWVAAGDGLRDAREWCGRLEKRARALLDDGGDDRSRRVLLEELLAEVGRVRATVDYWIADLGVPETRCRKT